MLIMASLDSQGEIVPKDFPNPEEPLIWGGEVPANIYFTFATSARFYLLPS